MAQPVMAKRSEIGRFHTPEFFDRVTQASLNGRGYLDNRDTPAFAGVYEAAARVVGTVLQAVADLINGETPRAFIPIAGLHHARRDAAAGFCVFNDCGVAIETLRRQHGVRRIAYVDIDAHHGDGIYNAFASDPELVIVDIHEDGRYLYPGTGAVWESGGGAAVGTKLNVPMPPGTGDRSSFEAWEHAESLVDKAQPEFIIIQCGADSLAGDLITPMAYSSEAHRHATVRLCHLADRRCHGRLLALGGGGYSLKNLANAWSAVVEAMVDADRLACWSKLSSAFAVALRHGQQTAMREHTAWHEHRKPRPTFRPLRQAAFFASENLSSRSMTNPELMPFPFTSEIG